MTIMSTQNTCRDNNPCLENSTSSGRQVTKPHEVAGKVKLSITLSLSRESRGFDSILSQENVSPRGNIFCGR